MNENRVQFPSFSITLPHEWVDVTASLNDVGAPITLADPVRGVGALQLSCAKCVAGPLPEMSLSDITSMLDEFGSTHDFQLQFDHQIYAGSLLLVGQSFKSDGSFVRVWYASDTIDVLFATYTCEWAERDIELAQREAAIMSLLFRDAS